MHEPADTVTSLYPDPQVRTRLRVGVAVDSAQLPAWIARMLSGCVQSGVADIVALVEVEAAPPRPPTGLAGAWLHHDSRAKRRSDWPQALLDLPGVCAGVPRLAVHADAAARDAALHGLQLDVLLDCTRAGLPAQSHELARFGIWWHVGGEPLRRLDEFALSTDLIDGDGCSLTGLVALSRAAVVPVCLARSVAATNRLSPEANRRYALWKTASLVPRALRRLAVRGRLPSGPVCATASEPAVVPSSMTVLRFLPRLLARRLIARHHRQHNVEHWQLAWRRAETPLDPAAPSQRGMRPLQTPHGHFWADPFLFHDHGRYWLFFEDLPYASGIGRIGCVEMAQTGPVGAARTVLELDSHLSYPQLFRWQGGIYLMPENGDANRVRVYRALEFPWRWEPAADILTGHNFSDATLWQHEDGRWYLFANVSESGGSVHDELFLFHADNPFGPWWPHAENPIVSDVRRARAAGPLFRHEGRLIRPAQDCAWNYGRAINFHVIDELSPTRYVERPLSRLRGYWSKDLHGCHTYTRADRLEAMDGKAFRSRRAVGASAMREPD